MKNQPDFRVTKRISKTGTADHFLTMRGREVVFKTDTKKKALAKIEMAVRGQKDEKWKM